MTSYFARCVNGDLIWVSYGSVSHSPGYAGGAGGAAAGIAGIMACVASPLFTRAMAPNVAERCPMVPLHPSTLLYVFLFYFLYVFSMANAAMASSVRRRASVRPPVLPSVRRRPSASVVGHSVILCCFNLCLCLISLFR